MTTLKAYLDRRRRTVGASETPKEPRRELTAEERAEYRRDAYMAGYGDMAYDFLDKEVSADHYPEGFTVDTPNGPRPIVPPG